MSSLTDQLNRPLRDLRISVTDRCNFRCTYCMPKEVFGRDFQFLPSTALLSFEEITRLSRIFIEQGIEKIRLTGGEPLVRRDLEKLVGMLAPLPGLKDLTLTTNGSLLAKKARALKDAGLRRITVSLDSLDNAVFKAMNDVDFPVEKVLEGIEAAREAGLGLIKINMVVKRGVNENSVVDMARYFKGTGYILRFIEYMDVGTTHRACQPQLQGRSGAALSLQGWQRRDRHHFLGYAAFLRRLHSRPPFLGGPALHLPFCFVRPRFPCPPARWQDRRRDSYLHTEGMAQTRRPLFRDTHA